MEHARRRRKVFSADFEQAKSDIRQAMRLSPRDPLSWDLAHVFGDAELGLGHFDAAIDDIIGDRRRFRSFCPYLDLAAAYALEGKMDEAKTALAEARRLNPKLTVKWLIVPVRISQPVFEGLRKAGLPEK